MNQKNIFYKRIIFLFAIILILLPNVIAFAVSSQYYDNNPLYMQPGETVDTFFTLQNIAGTENITLKAKIEYGEDILTLLDNTDIYTVPSGGKVKVNFKITAPTDAKKDDKFPITIFFTSLRTSSGGPVAIGASVGKGFDVIIKEAEVIGAPKEKTQIPIWAYIIIGIIILVIIIFLVLKKKGNKKR